jgi:type VI secretion system protein ImpK
MNKRDSFSTFGDDDKTFIRPSPGGRKRESSAMPPAPNDVAAKTGIDVHGDYLTGSNPICAHAFSLLSLVPKLRTLAFYQDINELQDQLIRQIREFENRTSHQSVPQEQIKIASYFICSLIDETVLNTPWGNQSNWGHHSLLIQIHNEAWGGERFFQILDHMKQHLTKNLNLLELAYLCLSLGFEGKYRIAISGAREIEQLRQELYLLIQSMRGDFERSLSVNWQGMQNLRSSLIQHVPIWVMAVVAASLLMLVYLGFSYSINQASDRVYKDFSALGQEQIKSLPARALESAPSGEVPARADRFRRLLAPEVARGMVEILDDNVLRISNSFFSGSDQIKQDFLPMLTKIAQELQADNSRILIVGHTDDRPIFSARFPSNWHLSQARAKSVASMLEASAPPIQKRIRFEGHADSEPIKPNDSSENRAQNRRIDIYIR